MHSGMAGGCTSVLFTRQFKTLTGGHLKVFDYMRHVTRSGWAEAWLYFAPGTCPGAAQPWVPDGVHLSPALFGADILFAAGMDWGILETAGVLPGPTPVVNLLQGLGHASPGDPRRGYLRRPALRICVSQEVADAVLETGEVNGPVHVIPNGIDLVSLRQLHPEKREGQVFIGGLKNPCLARSLAQALSAEGIKVDLCDAQVPRDEFLRRMANCPICVLLPLRAEGFFLPALEAMALGAAAVVPDCVGARSFCIDSVTALVPKYDREHILLATLALVNNQTLRDRLTLEGMRIADRHDLASERDKFLDLLHAVSARMTRSK